METTTQTKINYLKETKSQMMTMINNHGGTLTTTSTFRSYIDELDKLMGKDSSFIPISEVSETNPVIGTVKWTSPIRWNEDQSFDFSSVVSSSLDDYSSCVAFMFLISSNYVDVVPDDFQMIQLVLGKWLGDFLSVKMTISIKNPDPSSENQLVVVSEHDLPYDDFTIGPAPYYDITLNTNSLDLSVSRFELVLALPWSGDKSHIFAKKWGD